MSEPFLIGVPWCVVYLIGGPVSTLVTNVSGFPLAHIHTVAIDVIIPPTIPQTIPTISRLDRFRFPDPDSPELADDSLTVVSLYVLVTVSPYVVITTVDVGTYGESVAYTVATLVIGAPGSVVNVVTTTETAGDGSGGVYVTMIESARAYTCLTGTIRAKTASWNITHGSTFLPNDSFVIV